MSRLFNDLDPREYERQSEAEDRRRHFKVVRSVVNGEDENDALDREAVLLAQDFADVTDTTSILLTHLKQKPYLRCFVDAVIGATGGTEGFVEVTDEILAERMGRSTKTVQNYRNEFRAWPDHGAVIEIKDHWRDPETHESHPHRYACHITALAVEAALNARISPEWSRNRLKALGEAAQTVGDAAPCFPPRKAKKRRISSDAELMRRNLKQAGKLVDQVTALRQILRNPDFEEVLKLRQEIAAKLTALDEAFGFETPVSTQKKEVRSMEIDACDPPFEPSGQSHCMEAETEVETQVETPQVENFSTWNDSTESTTYGNRDFSSTEFPPTAEDSRNKPDEPETVDDGTVEEVYYPAGISDEEANAIWERAFGGLSKEVRGDVPIQPPD